MELFNDYMRKGSLEQSKKIKVSDIKRLLTEKVFYLPFEAVDSYGIAYELKKFVGMDINKILNKCSIEHGLGLRKVVCQIEVMHHISHILTFSPFREEVIKELTDITPVAIGPYIAYAEDYRSKEYIKEKKKNRRILLVMPSHSIPGISAEYSIKHFIEQIEIMKREFDEVVVCLYFEDMKKGLWKSYKSKGYQVLSAGNIRCPYFLSRLKYILSLSDAVVANGITTGMAYAMYMNRPFRLIRQPIESKVTCCNNSCELDLGYRDLSEKIYNLFDNENFIITEEQKKFGNYIFGLKSVKTKEEMGKLLRSLSREDNKGDME